MAKPYAGPALVPATPWLGSNTPQAPLVSAARTNGAVHLKLGADKAHTQFAIWTRHGTEWRFAVAPAGRKHWTVVDDDKLGAANAVFVSGVDRLGNESARVQAWRQ
jgi:hypothetical protein